MKKRPECAPYFLQLYEHGNIMKPYIILEYVGNNITLKQFGNGEMERSKNYKTDMIFLKSTIMSLLNYKNVIVDKCKFASNDKFIIFGKLFACLTGQDENKSIDMKKFYKVAAQFNHYTFVKKWSVK